MASSASRAASVEELKARGNDRFAKGDLCGAAKLYKHALQQDPARKAIGGRVFAGSRKNPKQGDREHLKAAVLSAVCPSPEDELVRVKRELAEEKAKQSVGNLNAAAEARKHQLEQDIAEREAAL